MKTFTFAFLVGSLLVFSAWAKTSADPAHASRGQRVAASSPAAGAKRPNAGPLLRTLFRIVHVFALVFMVLVVFALLFEKRFIFHPMRHPGGDWDAQGAAIEDCHFTSADGVRLHGWWLQAEGVADGPVLLWFHGNAGNITHRAENLRLLAVHGLSALSVDYRGYGRSGGSPSERGIYLDGEAAYDYLTGERGVAPGRIVSYGRSLGTSVAVHVALERPTAALVLEGAMSSARAMARRMMPLLPVWPFIRARLDHVGRIRAIDVPVLVMHGERDEIVPFGQGRAVYDAAPEPKEFYRIEGAGHNDTYEVGGEAYWRALVGFCDGAVRREGKVENSPREMGDGPLQ